jgi:hypothetical protein
LISFFPFPPILFDEEDSDAQVNEKNFVWQG